MHKHVAPVPLEKAYRLLNHGPTVLVSARHGGVDNVMAAAWACALDYSPPKLTVVLDKIAKTRELVEKSGTFVIQVPGPIHACSRTAIGTSRPPIRPCAACTTSPAGIFMPLAIRSLSLTPDALCKLAGGLPCASENWPPR